ncbi:MAG: hypothetical protein ACE5NP_02345 [Anaerolineae bacterium]
MSCGAVARVEALAGQVLFDKLLSSQTAQDALKVHLGQILQGSIKVEAWDATRKYLSTYSPIYTDVGVEIRPDGRVLVRITDPTARGATNKLRSEIAAYLRDLSRILFQQRMTAILRKHYGLTSSSTRADKGMALEFTSGVELKVTISAEGEVAILAQSGLFPIAKERIEQVLIVLRREGIEFERVGDIESHLAAGD